MIIKVNSSALKKVIKELPKDELITLKACKDKLSLTIGDVDSLLVTTTLTIAKVSETKEATISFNDFRSFIGKVIGNKYITIQFKDGYTQLITAGIELTALNKTIVNYEPMKFSTNITMDTNVNEVVYKSVNIFNKTGKASLKGIKFDFEKGMLVGTDTIRLTTQPIDKLDYDSIIVPKKAIRLGATITNIKHNNRYVKVTYRDGVIIITKLIKDTYPNYTRLLPNRKSILIGIKVNGLELKEKLKNLNKVKLTFLNGKLYVNEIDSKISFTLDCNYRIDKKYSTCINAKFLSDSILQNEITIHFGLAHRTLLLTNKNRTMTLIMPIYMGDINQFVVKDLKELLDNIDKTFTYTYTKPKKINKDKIIANLLDEVAKLKNEIAILKAK